MFFTRVLTSEIVCLHIKYIYLPGTQWSIRTPGLWLTPNSKLHARFSGNWGNVAGIDETGDELLLCRWYHLTYTLSDIKKRLDIYINGEWLEFFSIPKVQTQKVVFNDGPLYIGRNHSYDGFDGEIRYDLFISMQLGLQKPQEY